MWNRREPLVRVSGGFLLLAAWFGMECGWTLLGILLTAAAVHETAHWVVLRALGADVSRLRLTALGAVMTADCSALSYGRELAAVLAGPLSNLLCGGVLAAWAAGREPLYIAAGAHLVLGAFNLLPIAPLDGGRALTLSLSALLNMETAETVSRRIGMATAVLSAAVLAGVMLRSRGSLWLSLPAAGLLLTALRGRK